MRRLRVRITPETDLKDQARCLGAALARRGLPEPERRSVLSQFGRVSADLVGRARSLQSHGAQMAADREIEVAGLTLVIELRRPNRWWPMWLTWKGPRL